VAAANAGGRWQEDEASEVRAARSLARSPDGRMLTPGTRGAHPPRASQGSEAGARGAQSGGADSPRVERDVSDEDMLDAVPGLEPAVLADPAARAAVSEFRAAAAGEASRAQRQLALLALEAQALDERAHLRLAQLETRTRGGAATGEEAAAAARAEKQVRLELAAGKARVAEARAAVRAERFGRQVANQQQLESVLALRRSTLALAGEHTAAPAAPGAHVGRRAQAIREGQVVPEDGLGSSFVSAGTDSLDLDGVESVASEGLGFLQGDDAAGDAGEEEARLHMESVRLLASELGSAGRESSAAGLAARARTVDEKRRYAERLLEEKTALVARRRRELALEEEERATEALLDRALRLNVDHEARRRESLEDEGAGSPRSNASDRTRGRASSAGEVPGTPASLVAPSPAHAAAAAAAAQAPDLSCRAPATDPGSASAAELTGSEDDDITPPQSPDSGGSPASDGLRVRTAFDPFSSHQPRQARPGGIGEEILEDVAEDVTGDVTEDLSVTSSASSRGEGPAREASIAEEVAAGDESLAGGLSGGLGGGGLGGGEESVVEERLAVEASIEASGVPEESLAGLGEASVSVGERSVSVSLGDGDYTDDFEAIGHTREGSALGVASAAVQSVAYSEDFGESSPLADSSAGSPWGAKTSSAGATTVPVARLLEDTQGSLREESAQADPVSALPLDPKGSYSMDFDAAGDASESLEASLAVSRTSVLASPPRRSPASRSARDAGFGAQAAAVREEETHDADRAARQASVPVVSSGATAVGGAAAGPASSLAESISLSEDISEEIEEEGEPSAHTSFAESDAPITPTAEVRGEAPPQRRVSPGEEGEGSPDYGSDRKSGEGSDAEALGAPSSASSGESVEQRGGWQVVDQPHDLSLGTSPAEADAPAREAGEHLEETGVESALEVSEEVAESAVPFSEEEDGGWDVPPADESFGESRQHASEAAAAASPGHENEGGTVPRTLDVSHEPPDARVVAGRATAARVAAVSEALFKEQLGDILESVDVPAELLAERAGLRRAVGGRAAPSSVQRSPPGRAVSPRSPSGSPRDLLCSRDPLQLSPQLSPRRADDPVPSHSATGSVSDRTRRGRGSSPPLDLSGSPRERSSSVTSPLGRGALTPPSTDGSTDRRQHARASDRQHEAGWGTDVAAARDYAAGLLGGVADEQLEALCELDLEQHFLASEHARYAARGAPESVQVFHKLVFDLANQAIAKLATGGEPRSAGPSAAHTTAGRAAAAPCGKRASIRLGSRSAYGAPPPPPAAALPAAALRVEVMRKVEEALRAGERAESPAGAAEASSAEAGSAHLEAVMRDELERMEDEWLAYHAEEDAVSIAVADALLDDLLGDILADACY
jgi:hypothetical protein